MRVRFFAVLALLVMSLSPAIAAEIKMFRQSGCGCCGQWAEHMRAAGYTVTIVDGEVMSVIKKEAGVPAALESCHTAMVDGYVIEGHVPAADVDRLLKERPKAKGLAVAGMPMGSPGMEQPDGATEPYNTVLFGGEGGDTVFQGH
ncbi:MAG: DUF411 domain-containing protein [Hyphomicrobiaceae bacterium]